MEGFDEENNEDNAEENNDDNDDNDPPVSRQKAFTALSTLRDFLQQKGRLNSIEHLGAIEDDILNIAPSESKQKTILHFFKKWEGIRETDEILFFFKEIKKKKRKKIFLKMKKDF